MIAVAAANVMAAAAAQACRVVMAAASAPFVMRLSSRQHCAEHCGLHRRRDVAGERRHRC